MMKHEDGSITLSPLDVAALRRAYYALFKCVSRGPASMQDFYSETQYLNIARWYERLAGKQFRRSDWM